MPRGKYKPALDGLRAVAVYLVLLFHSGVGVATGGFIGVGLFFVLSGFLVTSILVEELTTTGTLALGRFYARRVRRLLPAALVCIVAVSLLFLLVESTVTRIPWVGDAQASLLYVVNWRYILQADDYFAADIDRSPFLHFWSLSVEEQYYLLFPVLLLLLARIGRRWRPAVPVGLAVLLVASLADQIFWARVNVDHAYYGTDARLYQLLAGGLAALAWRRRELFLEGARGRRAVSRRVWWEEPAASAVFLAALLVLASSLVDLSPSARDLVGTLLGVGIVLAACAGRGRRVDRFLTGRTTTYLGRISYGTYLWHWPVIVLLGGILDSSAWVVAAVTAVVASALAALSFEVLEHPIRSARALNTRTTQVVLVGVTASAVAALLLVPAVLGRDRLPDLAVADGTPVVARGDTRAVPKGIDWRAYAQERGSGNATCTSDDLDGCVVHEGSSGLRVGLIGDSHSRELAPALEKLAEKHDFTLALNVLGGCSWQVGVVNSGPVDGGSGACESNREALYDSMIADLDLDVVILVQTPRDSGRWEQDLTAADGSRESLDDLNLRTMTETVQRIHAEKADVVMMESWLRPDASGVGDPLACLSAARRVSECRVPVPGSTPLSDSIYRTLALTEPDAATVNINRTMCPAWPVCEAMLGDIPVWRDGGHYSAAALSSRRERIWDKLAATGFFDSAA